MFTTSSDLLAPRGRDLRIAVIGSGISGLSCAWLLAGDHRVTLYEAAPQLGGHSRTVEIEGPRGAMPVDIGFIVYNEPSYPNLTALFRHLGVATEASCMSFAVSLDGGRLEYAGTDLAGLFAQKRNLARPRFWSMLRQLLRFYRMAPADLARVEASGESLGAYLDRRGFGAAFQQDHLLPMAAAIWSSPAEAMRDYPAAAFIRFCDNHGLLRVTGRPVWRTVTGGSREYVRRLAASLDGRIRLGCAVRLVSRDCTGVTLHDCAGEAQRFDHVVIATHGDQALRLLETPSAEEARVLGAFRTFANHAVLHTDATLMPRRRAAWSSWNFIGDRGAAAAPPTVTYWMNRLQTLPGSDLFLTLNPARDPAPGSVLHAESFEHPVFDAAAIAAQRRLWSLQGMRRTWFCGAHFGAGFHEDGLQAGLAVAEALGAVRRPWQVEHESGRIHLGPRPKPARAMSALAA